MAKTFDGPPTLERSGSERRGGAVSSLSPEGERVGVEVEPSLMVKRDGVILEKTPSLRVRKDG